MTPSAPARRREGLWLGLLLVVALALRLFRLGQADLWWDEALAIWAVRKGLVGATVWTAGDVHPPLYFWALWAWVRLFGESPFAMRSLSVVIGTLTVWATYGLGRQVGGRHVGLLAAALTAVAPLAVWWSQEMRMYALAGLLCTLSWRQMLRWFDSERHAQRPDLRALALGALASLGALYTVFLSAAALVAQAALLLLYWLATGPAPTPGHGVALGRRAGGRAGAAQPLADLFVGAHAHLVGGPAGVAAIRGAPVRHSGGDGPVGGYRPGSARHRGCAARVGDSGVAVSVAAP